MIPQLFHPDELRAQTLAGFDRVGGGIYPRCRISTARFRRAALPVCRHAGRPGLAHRHPVQRPARILRTPDDTHLRISAPRRSDDPAQALLLPGKPVGALGLDFSNRRRNRANGTVGRTDKTGWRSSFTKASATARSTFSAANSTRWRAGHSRLSI